MKKRWMGRALALLLAAALLSGYAWLENGSYPAGEAARAALLSGEGVTVTQAGNLTVFAPDAPQRGLIFYPGGRVEAAAYVPLLRALAQQGWLCVLPEMPFDLAVLDMDAAQGIAERFPQVRRWAIGGHSLGGAMAASHAAKQPGSYDALILLAAYSTEDLAASGMQVVSLYGEYDGVLNREKYALYRANLPEDAIEIVIPGGNHARFGDYGAQKGDGEASVSMQAQIEAVVQALGKGN